MARETTSDIIPDSDVERMHANANFGALSKRCVVDDGVLKYAFGYSTGHTQQQILIEHGLIHVSHDFAVRGLTGKGRRYLKALGPLVFAALAKLEAT